MRTNLLQALRRDSKAWWWHRKLRKQGQTSEARKLEQRSIREDIRDLKNAESLQSGITSDYLKLNAKPRTQGTTRITGYRTLERNSGFHAAALIFGYKEEA